MIPKLLLAQQVDYGTNLWLEISGVTNGSVGVVLHNAQQGQNYELLSKVALTDTTWSQELAFPLVSNQNSISATVQMANRTNALFLRAMAMAAASGGFLSSYITSGLIEWNRFNDGAGTVATDASGNGNTVPLIGGPSWGSGDLNFDGSTEYGDAGSNQLSSLDQHDMTICVWINKTSSSLKGIVDKDYDITGVGHGGWSFLALANNQLEWYVQAGEDIIDNGGAGINVGQWTFVTVAWHYASNEADFYINGALNSKVQNGAAIENPSSIANFEVGNVRDNLLGGTYAFDGSMRDLGIYNRALTAAEVETNFLGSQSATGVDVPDLLYYEMLEYAQNVPPVYLSDSSTHGGTTGTMAAAPPNQVQWMSNPGGFPGKALHFDGYSTVLTTSNSTLFNFTNNPFTVNLWVRPDAATGYLMANGIPNMTGWYLYLGGSYQIQFGTQTNGVNMAIVTGPGAAPPGVYSMVTIVRTGPTNAVIYINGLQAATTGSITSPESSTNALLFGSSEGTQYLNGDIWLPQIWGHALSPTAVASMFFMESPGRPWPLVGTNVLTSFDTTLVSENLVQWNRLNDGAGSVAVDLSGNGNTFPLIGSPTWGSNYLTFNGSTQYGDAGSSQLTFLDQHDKTICGWINKSGSSFRALVDKAYVNGGVYGGWGFRVGADNHLIWWVQDGQQFSDSGAATIAVGQWTFVAVVWHYSSHEADFYINGVVNSKVGNGAAIENPSGPADLELGNMNNNAGGGTNAFDGSMRDIALYNRALSAPEIAANYLSTEFTTNVNTPDLLYYKMTEHAQTNPPAYLADSSVHGSTTGTVHSSYVLAWVTNVASIPETALHFNGVSTYIDTSNSVLFNFTTNLFTINFWARPLTANGFLMQNGVPLTTGWYVSVGPSYQIQFGTETNGTDTAISTGPGAAEPEQFTMVTIARTGPTNALIYINGIQAATTGGITVPAPSNASLKIGVDADEDHFLDGDIWQPQIWGEPLSATAIANLYLIQSAGQPWP